jgi:hypothetical protein
LLALLGAHHILHVSRIRVKSRNKSATLQNNIPFWFTLQNQHHADASPQKLKRYITKPVSDYTAEQTLRHKGSAKIVLLQSPIPTATRSYQLVQSKPLLARDFTLIKVSEQVRYGS